jgi:GntR family transcriptional repressor for pyruvate dehydrogenase complex
MVAGTLMDASTSNQSRTGQLPRLEPIERVPVTARVVERLKELIASHEYAPGSRLPSERELRELLGVGRSTIREALRGLEALGMIELRQGVGAYVRDLHGDVDDGPGFAAWPRKYRIGIESMLVARLAIEPPAAALAAINRSQAQLEKIGEQLAAFSRAIAADDLAALALADVAFHDEIARAGDPLLAQMLESVEVLSIRSRRTSLARHERRPSVYARHERIYEAICAGDAAAASKAMSSHLLDFAKELGIKGLPNVAVWQQAYEFIASEMEGEEATLCGGEQPHIKL